MQSADSNADAACEYPELTTQLHDANHLDTASTPLAESPVEMEKRWDQQAENNDFDISIIWHNVYAGSDFIGFRKESRGPIERILRDFGRVLESGVFEQVLSVNASKHLFCVTVACTRNMDQGVKDAIFSVL